MSASDSQKMALSEAQVWNSAKICEDPAWYPNEQMVRFIVKYLRKRTGLDAWKSHRQVRRVLDLGCGTGRHVKLLAEQKFEVHGLDISWVSVQFASRWMRILKQPASLAVASSCQLPYRSGSFDVIVSHGVLDHMTLDDARVTAGEVRRILAPDGLFYLDLISKADSTYGQGKQIDPETFIVPEGIEAGAVQRFYDPNEIETLLGDLFELKEIVFQSWYPVLGRGFSNLDKGSSDRVGHHAKGVVGEGSAESAAARTAASKLARYHVVAQPNHTQGGEPS